jgi:hypothetical protein
VILTALALAGRLLPASGESERMKLIIAQRLAIISEKWQSQKQPARLARNTLLIKLRNVRPESTADNLIITAVPIVVLVLFFLAAYVITKF